MELVVEGISGGLGGLLGRAAAFPFDTLKVRLATNSDGSLLALLKRIIAEEGVYGLYRGLLPFSALEATEQKALYVLNYAAIKSLLRRLCGEPGILATVFCGYLSDLLCVPISVPVEALVVQLQTNGRSGPAVSTWQILQQALFTREGLATAMKSGRAYFVLSLKPGIEFAFFDRIKSMILKGSAKELQPLTAFFLGAVARAIAHLFGASIRQRKSLSTGEVGAKPHGSVAQGFLGRRHPCTVSRHQHGDHARDDPVCCHVRCDGEDSLRGSRASARPSLIEAVMPQSLPC